MNNNMIYYITLYIRYEFDDSSYAMNIAEYALNSYLGENEYNRLLDLNRRTIEFLLNKNVVKCYAISKSEYESDKSEEKEINIIYTDEGEDE